MGLGGLEPPTSPLSGVRSNQLSYRPSAIWPTHNTRWHQVRGLHAFVVQFGLRPGCIATGTGNRTPVGAIAVTPYGVGAKDKPFV